MMEYLWTAVILLLALYGAAQGVGRLIERMWRPPDDIRPVVLLPLAGHHEDVEHLLRCAATRHRWAGVHTRVVLVDAGMDDETRALAGEVCARLESAEIWDEDKVGEYIKAI